MINITTRVKSVCNLFNRASNCAEQLVNNLRAYLPRPHRVNHFNQTHTQTPAPQPASMHLQSVPLTPVQPAVSCQPAPTEEPVKQSNLIKQSDPSQPTPPPTVVTTDDGPVRMFEPPAKKQLDLSNFSLGATIKVNCNNRRRSDTGGQCTNQVVPHSTPGGACPDCLHQCKQCGQTIPVWFPLCLKCSQKSKPVPVGMKKCRTCGTHIPMHGPAYCDCCGHKCKGCSNIIPKRFDYCQRESCQDMKHQEGYITSPSAKRGQKG